MSHVMCHVSWVMCHMSRVTCHMSRVMCPIFLIFFRKWWILSVERLLSTGPTPSSFHQLGPLGWVGLVVAMCVSLFICLMSPFHVTFSRPHIGPQITWPDPGLSLVNPLSLPYGGGGGGGPQDFCVSQSSFWTNKGFELGWTGLGLGLGVLRTKGSGQCSH